MSRRKIDYGIDLGTTNSAIVRMENGKPVIIKSDTLKDTLPSCINFNKKQSIIVGDAASNSFRSDTLKALKTLNSEINTFIEFKRTMGTDKKYKCSNMGSDFLSEDLSSEVLKKLKSFISEEELNSIVVTVPAKFTVNQKDATRRAAILAGFDQIELLQEPIAASMAYGLDVKSKDGIWLVFDFGGGTFDAALLKVEDGIMKIIDTEGDNHLGGKNIDFSIVDELLIPHMNENYSIESYINDDEKREYFRNALKVFAEPAKIQLSFSTSIDILSDPNDFPNDDNGVEMELDYKLTEELLEPVISPIFQKAIDITNDLLKRNNLTGKNLDSLILVGGPTYSPILRKMLKEQITDNVDTSVDPMTVVAQGAALFASTVDVKEEIVEKTRDNTKIQLSLGYESTTVEPKEFLTIKILKDKTEGLIPDKIYAEIINEDKSWSSGKTQIDELGEVLELNLNEGRANSFKIIIYNELGDQLSCEPNQITIIQGSKIGNATLPYNLGIEIKSNSRGGRIVFQPVKGLEKNQTTPATGIANNLKTQKQIRPGLKSDFIKIPIYQGDHGTEGTRAIHLEHVYDFIISGEQLPALLPEGSFVDLTIKADRSEKITLSVFFQFLDFTEEVSVPSNTLQKEIDAEWLDTEISKAKQFLNLLKNDVDSKNSNELEKLNSELTELENLFEQGKGDYDRKKQVLNNLRKCLIKLDNIQDASEFPKIEEELKDAFYKLEELFSKIEGKYPEINDNAVKESISEFKEQIPEVIKDKNVKDAKELIELISAMDFSLYDIAMGAQLEISLLKDFNENFDIHEWSDPNKAKMLIKQGLSIAATTPTKQKLRPIVIEIYRLLPNRKTSPPWDDDVSILTD